MAPRKLTLDDALADFHTLYVLDERSGALRTSDEYQRRFPGFEDVVRAEYAFLSGDAGATPVELPRSDNWAPSDAGLAAGREIGPYQLVRMLGRGAQGTVYLAKHVKLGRFVALKVLANTWLFSPAHRARFVREARAAARLEHEGICAVHDFGCEQDIDFIAMQYVEGETLYHCLRRAIERRNHHSAQPSGVEADLEERALDAHVLALRPSSRSELNALLRFFERIAESLQVAHDAGIVHRDIKPGNIMVTPALRPVVLDFGLARDDQGEPDHATRTGDLIGTRGYIAPEQMRGELDVDARVDVYALGVALYECLTLSHPYPQPTWEALVQAIDQAAPPSVRSLNPRVPRDVALIVQTALEKTRERRYRTARDLAEDLRRAREGLPLLAEPPSWPDRASRWVQRHSRAIVKVTAAVSLAGLVVVSFWVASLLTERNGRSKRDQFAVGREHALEPSYVTLDLSGKADFSRIDFRGRARAYVESLRLGGVDLESSDSSNATLAPSEIGFACEPDEIDLTSWMVFQVVEDIDTILAASSKDVRGPQAATVEADASWLAHVRAGAARFLDTRLRSAAAQVWRVYDAKGRAIPDATRHDVLASKAMLPRIMLIHVAWDQRNRELAGLCLDEESIRSEDDGAFRHLASQELGTVRLSLGQYAAAKHAFEMGQWSAPRENVFDYLNLARVAAAQNDAARAEMYLRKGRDLEPQNVVILTSLANVLATREKFAEAFETAQAAVDSDPQYAAAHLELGRAMINTDRVRDGLEELDEALVKSGRDPTMELAANDAIDGATDGAALDGDVVDLLRSIEPSAFWYGVRAHAQLGLGNLGVALELAEAGLALEPEHFRCLVWRANAYMKGVDAESALAMFDRIVARYPENIDGRTARARCLEWIGRTDEAIDTHFEASKLEGWSPTEFLPLVLAKGTVDAKRKLVAELTRRGEELPVALSVGTSPQKQAVRELRSALLAACDAVDDVDEAMISSLGVAGRQDLLQHADRARSDALAALAAGFEREDARAFFEESRSLVESLPLGSLRTLAQAYVALALGRREEAVDGFVTWLREPNHDVEAVGRVVELLLRSGESARVAAVVSGWDRNKTKDLAPLAAQAYLADGRSEDAVGVIADAPLEPPQMVFLAKCSLAAGRPEGADAWLDRLRCYQLVRPEVSSFRARVVAALDDTARAASDSEPIARTQEDRDRELTRVCDADLALPLARARMTSALDRRAKVSAADVHSDGADPDAALRVEQAMENALDMLELHLARCQGLLGSVQSDTHERCVLELKSVLTDPEFALLRHAQGATSFAHRATSYFESVRRTLGSALYAR